MAKLSSIAIDTKKSIDGVWCPLYDGIELKIARINNPDYEKYREKLNEPFLRQIRASIIDKGVMADLTKQAVAKCVLIDWKNIEDEVGQPIPYSYEKALEILRNPAYVQLADFVMAKACDYELYRQVAKSESIKN
jgi:hypothetical protein